MRPIPFLLALLFLWSCERPDDFRSNDPRDVVGSNATAPRLQIAPFPNLDSYWIYCGSYWWGKHEHHRITDSIWYQKDTVISIQEDITGVASTHTYKLLRVLRRDVVDWVGQRDPKGALHSPESQVMLYPRNQFVRIDDQGRWISLMIWISPTGLQKWEQVLMDIDIPIGTPWVEDYRVTEADTVIIDDRWAVQVSLREPYRTFGVDWIEGIGPTQNSLLPGYDGWQTTYFLKKHFIY